MSFPRLPGFRRYRFAVIFLACAGLACASLAMAFAVRFDLSPNRLTAQDWGPFKSNLGWMVMAKLFALAAAGQFSGLLTFFSAREAVRLAVAIGGTVFVILVLQARSPAGAEWLPPGVTIVDALLFTGMTMALRLALRRSGERSASLRPEPGREKPVRVAIVGAGQVAGSLIEALRRDPRSGFQPVVIVDDDPRKWGLRLHGIRVEGSPALLPSLVSRAGIRQALIAMPSAPGSRVREIVGLCGKAHIRCVTVPSLPLLASGKVPVNTLKEVEIEDLLGRHEVRLSPEAFGARLRDRVILVTGAGGSIGSELCRQIAACRPSLLILLDQAEPALFLIEQELLEARPAPALRAVVADILDEPRMRRLLRELRPALIFHAAAHKHVPMMEDQPGEAVKNNAFGVRLMVRLAAEYGVERCVLISTDKAVNPTSVMGASKRMGELYLQAWQRESGSATRYSAVRFGNVLGSSGSVIPVFKKQIAAGGPVRVTHPEITRFFMTIPEAVGLVLQSGLMAEGGEIFVLEMGRPVRIADLATQLIELSGLAPGRDIAIEFTGLRPGEKLYEELSHAGELVAPTSHDKILRFTGPSLPLAAVEEHFDAIAAVLAEAAPLELKGMIRNLVPEYTVFQAAGEAAPGLS